MYQFEFAGIYLDFFPSIWPFHELLLAAVQEVKNIHAAFSFIVSGIRFLYGTLSIGILVISENFCQFLSYTTFYATSTAA